MPSPAPEDALGMLAEQLRSEDSVISPHVRNVEETPALGLLAAAGPRTAAAAGGGGDHEGAKAALRQGRSGAAHNLLASARAGAWRSGISDALAIAADSVGLDFPEDPSDLGGRR